MKIEILITLEPDNGPAQMVSFEQTSKRGLSERNRDTRAEALLAGKAFLALTDDVKCWVGGRLDESPVSHSDTTDGSGS